jgi:hypothetical protein
MNRFIAYGSKEWNDLTRQVKDFATGRDLAFGDGVTPMPAPMPPAVFDDHTVPDDTK